MAFFKLLHLTVAIMCRCLFVSGNIPYTNYEYEIDTIPSDIKEGYVLPDAQHGSMVRLHSIENDIRKGVDTEYIRLDVKGNIIGVNESFLVVGTDAFMIDDDNFLVVNNSEDIETSTEVIFNVFLVSESDHKILSNALPLAVHRDKRVEDKSVKEYSSGAAIFAGVLVLFIVFMALLIPLVIRAKRRLQEGKHPFKLGSHPSTANLNTDEVLGIPPKDSSEPNWYNNTVFNYEDEVRREKSEFTHDIIAIGDRDKVDSLQLNKKQLEEIKPTQTEEKSEENGVKGILKNGTNHIKTTATIETTESKL
ncbi:uncharacterized protein LOC110455261 [Mizuhopecten yessoensis]|uniref:Cadherin domain-containing protein n=1 Tax=Mizuhopecten yessoensis TaxID=6573 RepID=A0A210QDE7_MIZYE|nr:uncharacterized protein LOC110455261 [Mizuhopecten yessoensis]OWF46742.1 hypothetical protein KP79_PYT21238 [Mizuhopecten yessoensis]